MPVTPDYRQEFPGRPEIEVAIPEGFEDSSWCQDVCPKFYSPALGLVLWIEEPDADKREFPDLPRFCLQRVNVLPDSDYEFPDGPMPPLCESDDWQEILAAIEEEKKAQAT